MNSIKPIISAKWSARGAAIGLIAATALGGSALALRDVHAAVERALGLDAARQIEAMAPSAARDTLLMQGQMHLSEAIAARGRDSEVWLALSRIRFHQATGAEIGGVSPILLDAAAGAALRAEEFEPGDAEAPGRVAEALSLAAPARRAEAANALARSYALAPLNMNFAAWRTPAAARLWLDLPAPVRAQARAEACAYAVEGGAAEIEALAVGAHDPAVAAAFDEIRRDPNCVSPSASPDPETTPPAPEAEPA